MIEIIRTDSNNNDFIELVKLLDADLAIRDGKDHIFYAQFNKTGMIKHVLVAFDSGQPIGCGAMRLYAPGVMEIKRMYTLPGWRSKGIATQILTALEIWASELSFKKCLLETGKNQPEAIALYKKNNYHIIPNYGQYDGIENSVCFEKTLI